MTDACPVHFLFRMPQFIVFLQVNPERCGVSEGDREFNGQFRTYARPLIDNRREVSPRNMEAFSYFGNS